MDPILIPSIYKNGDYYELTGNP